MDTVLRAVLQLLFLVATCHALSKFEANCSMPSHSVSFVSSPNSRGTLNILWTSLFTLLTCTWTIQHLNVPAQRDPTRDKSDVKWNLKGVWSNLKWMIITMVAPEYIVGKAFSDLISARKTRELLQVLAKDDKVEWSLSHSFFADMGGFVGVCEDDPLDENGEINKLMAQPLTAEQIHWLQTNGRSGEEGSRKKLEKLPDITKAELLDKSKGDVFVKTITASQVSWGVVQIAVRANKGLAVSQLELAVAAFSACAVATYLMLLYKPQGVRVPTRPIVCAPKSTTEVWNLLPPTAFRSIAFPALDDQVHLPKDRLPNDSVSNDPAFAWVGVVVGGTLFGGIHIVGWNFVFPTLIEQLLWRVGSVYMTLIFPTLAVGLISIALLASAAENECDTFAFWWIFVPFVALNHHLKSFKKTEGTTRAKTFVPFALVNGVAGIVYIFFRLFILVEIFRTLLYLPPDVYVSTWASNLPHVA